MLGTILLKLCPFFPLLSTIFLHGMYFHLYFTGEEIKAQGKYVTVVNYHAIGKKSEIRMLLNISIYHISF